MNVVDIAEVFLIPSGLFLTALGSARTEPLKTAVSLLGFATTAAWLYVVVGVPVAPDAPDAAKRAHEALILAPRVFAVIWFASTLTHAWLWCVEWLSDARVKAAARAAAARPA